MSAINPSRRRNPRTGFFALRRISSRLLTWVIRASTSSSVSSMLESPDTLHCHFHLLRVSLEDSVYVCDFFADPDIVSSTVAPSQKSVWAIITLFTDLPTARITLARLVFFSLLSFSLIKKAAMDNTYSVHSLVHSWSRDSGQRREGYFFAHNLLSSLIDLVFACEDYTFRRNLFLI